MKLKRKLYLCDFVILITLFASCSGKSAVKKFAQEFAKAVSDKDTMMIYKMYPLASKCDSCNVVYDGNSAEVEGTDTKGTYVVRLNDSSSITVAKSEDGELQINDSHNVLCYKNSKKEFAKTTGWIDKDMSDKQIAEQFADTCFESYVYERAAGQLSTMLTVKDVKEDYVYKEGSEYPLIFHIFLKNSSSFDIDGDDYKLKNVIFRGEPTRTVVLQGKDVKAGGTVEFTFGHFSNLFDDIEPTVSFGNDKIRILGKYYKPNGNEYKAYQFSKGK